MPDPAQPHVERRVRDCPPADFTELAQAAGEAMLALYVGAGISVPTPTLLPTSRQLLERLAPLVDRELGVRLDAEEGAGVRDAQATLEQLADRASVMGVLPSFRVTAAGVENFREAPPTYGHRVIAALLREGSVTVFSVNWDRCIEKGGAEIGFHVDPTITDADRAVRFAGCRFHKIHGCATQPETLLITTEELDAPPPWVLHDVGAALGASTMVFVGLGTVGGYVRRRVVQVLGALGAGAAVWLADPYPSETWAELLTRADRHVLEVDANRFFDDLLRACVRQSLARLGDAARVMDAQMAGTPVAPSVDRLVGTLEERRALELVNWLRAGARGVADGRPFLHADECRTALLALAMISKAVEFRMRGEHERLVLEAGSATVELAVWPETRADMVVARETARVTERHDRHCYDGLAPRIVHICVGHRGPLPRADAAPDIGGGGAPAGDLVEAEPTHEWIPAEALLQGAFEIELAA